MAGLEVNSTDRNAINCQGWGFVYDNGGIPFINPDLFDQFSQENSQYYGNTWTYRRSFASFANSTSSYSGRSLLNGTIRIDVTNKQGNARSSLWLRSCTSSLAWHSLM